jgi:hypothetical protein
MKNNAKAWTLLAAVSLASAATLAQAADAKAPAKRAAAQKPMSFFVTSTGLGKGADLGGLAGADAHCQNLAKAAGAGNRTWHAYLSTTAVNGGKVVNARDRIGTGPWYNVKGELIAKDVDDLHTDNKITKQSALSEKGTMLNGAGDNPNTHDILTGSDSFGYAFEGKSDTTCGNWTSSAASGSAQVGHFDRRGLNELPPAKSWNNAHPSRGCSQDALRSSGGAGLLYCFAAR